MRAVSAIRRFSQRAKSYYRLGQRSRHYPDRRPGRSASSRNSQESWKSSKALRYKGRQRWALSTRRDIGERIRRHRKLLHCRSFRGNQCSQCNWLRTTFRFAEVPDTRWCSPRLNKSVHRMSTCSFHTIVGSSSNPDSCRCSSPSLRDKLIGIPRAYKHP